MRKPLILLLALIISLFLTGCWSRVELNDVAIVTATALDRAENNKLQVSLQILKVKMTKGISEKGGGGENATLIVSEKGETIMEAYQVIQKKIPRMVIFSHNRVIVVGDQLARAGLSPVLDFFSRHREARGNSYLLVTKGEGKEILKAPPNFEIFTAEEIREEEKARYLDSVTFRDFVFRLLEKGIEPICTQLQIVPLSGQKNDASDKKETGLAVVGAGIFHHDKLIGWMKRQDSEVLLWLKNRMKRSSMTVSMQNKDGSTGKVSVQLSKAKTSIRPRIQGEKIQFDITMHMTGELFENTTKLSIKEIQNLNKIQQVLEQEVKKRVTSTVNKLKKQFKSDAVGFGTILHRKYKKEWNETYSKRWDQEFPKIEVTTDVQFKINGTGRVNDSTLWEEEQLEK
ncbi:Ger(x)C family spore germination protein [Paenibacillus pinihumi]|uniref:Ger(x)C family spore germination protein n=1 Tax=Paenibacillus pinihumi TaxID=669462 RepID=UPI00048ADA11|nr:Ger(x)C family spore germination protein [Paenibacillus pinihumi]